MLGAALLAALLLLSIFSPAPALRILQQDSRSNSDACLETIPKCESGACAARIIQGVSRWSCLRCLGNYQPVFDDAEQGTIVQCVCPSGFFEAAAGAPFCTRCPHGAYCPGGDKVPHPISRGRAVSCGPGLITRNTGARSQSDCVAAKGWAMTSPGGATPCGPSEYSPQFNRLSRCLSCQSGLQEPPDSNLTAGDRSSKRAVCKVPPGRYMSQGLVRLCPQGFFRQHYLDYDDQLAQTCMRCQPGITTNSPGATSAQHCNMILPGYGLANVQLQANRTPGAASILPALPSSTPGGLPAASICSLGYYSDGGYCVECPGGSVTNRPGAEAVEECAVPPGYFMASGQMLTCSSGTYRQGWVLLSDPRASRCTLCGSGIASEARELDVNPLAAAGSLVRATSASCYIEAGQAMNANGPNSFAGRDCPANTYGASDRVYGLISAPCKPCPRLMVTDGAVRVNSSAGCINRDGYGYTAEGSSYLPGFYAAKGSLKPCTPCPPGRTTLDLPSAQRISTDCLVMPGHGVVSTNSNTSKPYAVDTSGLTEMELASLPVVMCPMGYYSTGNTTGAQCQACPAGSSTTGTGAAAASTCSVCIPGYGRVTPASPCTLCLAGTYQPGSLDTCQACPNTTFYPPSDGVGEAWTSIGITTFPGAAGHEACVPMQSQLAPEAGQALFGNISALKSIASQVVAPSLAACLATCPSTVCCMAQYNVTSSVCTTALLAPAGADTAGWKLFCKLPSSSQRAAAGLNTDVGTVGAKTVPSGIYARALIPDTAKADWLAIGANIEVGARTITSATRSALWYQGSETECKNKCDSSGGCWSFVFDGSSCLFRAGEDEPHTRAFFVLPSGLNLSSFQWQGQSGIHLDLAPNGTTALQAALPK